nr:30S ribosomal protein S17, small subunit ribosomal protein S17 [uncultured Microgenomates bacterium Rifle_16ft_4_minimus_37836]
MEKTATVAVNRVVVHPVYKKRFRKTKKYHVHDEIGVEVGQEVRFVASKPISRTKRWKIIDLVDRKQSLENKKSENK